MALTRRLLKELQLSEETIGTIIAAHADSLAGLKEERDAWREAAAPNEALKEERDRLSAQVGELTGWQAKAEALQAEQAAREAAARQAEEASARTEALTAALTARGANQAALPLLLMAAERDAGSTWEAEALAGQLAQSYPAMFASVQRIPTGRIDPPVGGASALTPRELDAMSLEEINDNWSAVKSALMKGE